MDAVTKTIFKNAYIWDESPKNSRWVKYKFRTSANFTSKL